MTSPMPPSRPPSAPATSWQVTDQVQTTEADGQGRPARGWRISFQTGQGVTGSVFVTEQRYTTDNVRAAVAAAAAQIDQVHQLRG